ncbi:unnamed protein product [Orchesella dallaii]|uniref:Transient receptor potential channel pyrexia n=1 Tax=Orchesella dallaii TaxID=48710 RepID=A0ABP1Q6S6_9HEXA
MDFNSTLPKNGTSSFHRPSIDEWYGSSVQDFPLHDYEGIEVIEIISRLKNSEPSDIGNEEQILFVNLLKSALTGIQSRVSSSAHAISCVINRLDDQQGQGASPLHYAALMGHYNIVLYLLDNEAEVNIWDKNQTVTPLICAAAKGHLEIVKALLYKDADINAGLNTENYALLWAVRKGHNKVVEYLLQQNASQNSAVMYSETPIHSAVLGGHTQILESLIEANGKADLCMSATNKVTPLHIAASGEYPNSLECCKILLGNGKVQVNCVTSRGQTPLHLAGTSVDPNVVKLLISNKAYVDALDNEGKSPLFYFISDDKYALECIQILVDAKCNLNLKDKSGFTVLHAAAFKEASGAAELLLLNGADYSIKGDGGVTSLSLLLRKIQNMPVILQNVFDQAVSLTKYAQEDVCHMDCKVKVNFRCVVSTPSVVPVVYTSQTSYDATDGLKKGIKPNESLTSSFRFNAHSKKFGSRETSKIKCLIDENQGSLLLHPVVHSFLSMKWQKAKAIFFSIFIFKAMLVLLFSLYLQSPYIFVTNSSNASDSVLTDPTYSMGKPPQAETDDTGDIPIWYWIMYALIITLNIFNAVMELAQLIRSPKSLLLSLEPWISALVFGMMIYMQPKIWWKDQQEDDLLHRSVAALAICLAWVDMWMYMGRFPAFGLSIRVFFKVLHNFFIFVLPHTCLFAGFCFAFTLLFQRAEEFSLLLVVSKAIRIMAGDITIPMNLAKTSGFQKSNNEGISQFVIVYIYTAYVLTVGIVLMNLLIGLAVNDIQGIYAEASMHRLTKQTILLNTLETNFSGKWIGKWIPKRFVMKYITLFPSAEKSNSTTLTFKPYDSRDIKLNSELKKEFVNLRASRDKSDKEILLQQPGGNSPTEKILLKKVDELLEKVSLLMDNAKPRDGNSIRRK